MATSRMPLYDNAKFILIVLVVVGHAIDMGAVVQFEQMKGLFTFIYSFHMPLFLFISGLFLKRENDKLNLPRVFSFVALGLLLKILTFATQRALSYDVGFDLFSDVWMPWFMFALAAYQVLTWALRNVKTVPVLLVSIIVALCAGYDTHVSAFLSLSRIIVFFPFFWMGFVLTPQRVAHVVKDRRYIAASAAVVVVFALFCIFATDSVYAFRDLFTAWKPYQNVATMPDSGWMQRLGAYLIAAAMSAAVLGLIPNRSIRGITVLGQRTLQVFFWHYPILLILVRFGMQDAFISLLPSLWPLLTIVMAVGLSFLLSIRVFGVPLNPILHATISKPASSSQPTK